ncbi:MAG: hypothetical protein LBH80_02550 [Prevotellaceae bacterium]|jgi:hypothetical protein|nr:hypothetical protein [Prevotellaceae bacterium]
MKKLIVCLLLISASSSLFSQDAGRDIITLKTGNTYTGNIVFRNDDVVLLQTDSGERFQFLLSAIKEIKKRQLPVESDRKNEGNAEITDMAGNDHLRMQLIVSGGASFAEKSFDLHPSVQASLLLATDDLLDKPLTAGFGLGYHAVLTKENDVVTPVPFLPLFAHLQYNFSKARHRPFVGFDVGYAFALSEKYKGGPNTKLSAGYAFNMTYKTAFYAGLFYGLQGIAADLHEELNGETYQYLGKTVINTFGLHIVVQF